MAKNIVCEFLANMCKKVRHDFTRSSQKNMFKPHHEAAKSVLLMPLNVYKTIFKNILDVEDDLRLSAES